MATRSAAELINAAKEQVEHLTPQQVQEALTNDNVTLIDLRESEELAQNGKIPGAVHAPRGLLEFYADPSHAYYKPAFDPGRKIILHCATGGRSALAAQTLKEMGYEQIAHLDGGIKAWKEAGMQVE